MVNKRTPKSAPQEERREDICLDRVAVEIKEEDELIIEDTADDQIRWCFIGLDDNEDELQEFCPLNQTVDHSVSVERQKASSLNLSYDDVIEITDDEDDELYDSIHNFPNESGEIGVSNEPIQDSFIINDDETKSNAGEHHVDDASQNADCTNGYHTEEEEELDKDTKEFIDEHTSPTTRRHRRNKENASDGNDNDEGLTVIALKEMMSRKYMKIKCHKCDEVFSFSIYTWLRHMREQHDDFHSKMLSVFSFHTENLASCKLCKTKVNFKVNHIIHYILQHSEITPKLFLCSVCSYADTSVFALQEHQKEKHALNDDEDDTKYEECPKCHEGFKNSSLVEYHFQVAHYREFWAKFRYACHLCAAHPKFDSNKKSYYGHFTNEHKLNNWKVLKFRKFDSGRHVQCTDCLKIFTNAEDTNKLLGHYLTHQVYCFWSCRFCEATLRFNDSPALHLCSAMKEYYGGKNKDDEDNKAAIQKLISWNEFEVYVKHVCPFCMQDFDKFEDWRLHVREIHFIHTLEGLNMSIIPHDPDKLQCLQCLAPVIKSAVELHKHRFQHLPHLPYKCRHCPKSLATYNLALNHVLTRCDDEVSPCTSKALQTYKLKTETECSSLLDVNSLIVMYCTLCNNKRFSDFEEISRHFRNVHDNFQQYFTKTSKDRKRKCKVCQIEISKNTVSVTVAHYLQHLHERPFKCRKCHRSYPVLKRARNHVIKHHYKSIVAAEGTLKPIKEEKEVDGKTKKPIKKEKLKKENEVEAAKSQKWLRGEKYEEPTKVHQPIKKETDVDAEKSKKSMQRQQKDVNTEEIKKYTEKASGSAKRGKEVEPEPKSALRFDESAKVLREFEPFIRYACPECNESIPSLQLWEKHIQTKHTFFHPSNLCVVDAKDGKLKCKDCNLRLLDYVSRQRRHKLSHMTYTSFICSLCGVGFTHLSALYIHMRRTHFAKYQSKCPLCPKILSTGYDKSEHMKQAHSRKDWPDDMCLLCFQAVPDVETHVRVHHISRTKISCAVCGCCFIRQKDLEQHMATNHSKLKGKAHKDSGKAQIKNNSREQPLSEKRKLSQSSPTTEAKRHKAKKRRT